MDVYIATTEHYNEPRWFEDGSRNMEEFIDGLFTDPDVAKVVSINTCGDNPARWRRTARGNWIAGHRWMTGTGETHFHRVQRWLLDDPSLLAYAA